MTAEGLKDAKTHRKELEKETNKDTINYTQNTLSWCSIVWSNWNRIYNIFTVYQSIRGIVDLLHNWWEKFLLFYDIDLIQVLRADSSAEKILVEHTVPTYQKKDFKV